MKRATPEVRGQRTERSHELCGPGSGDRRDRGAVLSRPVQVFRVVLDQDRHEVYPMAPRKVLDQVAAIEAKTVLTGEIRQCLAHEADIHRSDSSVSPRCTSSRTPDAEHVSNR